MKFLKIALLLVACLLLCVIAWLIIGSRDAILKDNTDLILENAPLLPSEDNIQLALPTAEDLETKSDQEIVTMLQVALTRTGYQCPTEANNHVYDADICPLNTVRDTAQVAATYASTSLAEGDVAATIEASTAILELADHVSDSQGSLIEEFVAMAIYRIGIESVQSLLAQNVLTENQKQQLLAELIPLQPTRENLYDAHRSEYMSLLDIVDRISSGNIKNFPGYQSARQPIAYLWHPNRTKNEITTFFRLMISEKSRNEELLEQVESYTYRHPFMIFLPNGVGQIFLTLTISSLNDASDKFTELENSYTEIVQALSE